METFENEIKGLGKSFKILNLDKIDIEVFTPRCAFCGIILKRKCRTIMFCSTKCNSKMKYFKELKIKRDRLQATINRYNKLYQQNNPEYKR